MDPWQALPIKPGLEPMEARLVDELPRGDGWQFEPKWDGFRCLVFRSGAEVALQSKSGKPLARYFPEVVGAVQGLKSPQLVLDGELVIPVGGILSFDALQMRLHPAASRIKRLAEETPAQLMLFDCLLDGKGRSLIDRPLAERRSALECFHDREPQQPLVQLSSYTLDRSVAQSWLDQAGASLDGVVAKQRSGVYEPGERAMLKIKCLRTADCVVGGFRYASRGGQVGSLLLGLYDEQGRLNHVGFTSSFPASERPGTTRRLEALVEPPGFTGRAPGGPSRWSSERSGEWQPVRAELVVEVRYDHVTGDRFRHGTKFLRWRPDKATEQCRMDQLRHEARPAALAAMVRGLR